jgi:hypothetical protein
VQANNDVQELPLAADCFKCLVANFSDSPVPLRKGQIVGLSESVHSYPICAVHSEEDYDPHDSVWENIVSEKVPHLSEEER